VRLATSVSRIFFRSKSKIPPQLGGPVLDVVEPLAYRVDVLGFHERFRKSPDYTGRQ
jgi:hypothetical protein